MHDLIHDLAKKVAGEELFAVNSNNEVSPNKLILEENVRHVSLIREIKDGEYFSSFEVQGRRLRMFLQHVDLFWLGEVKYNVDELVLNCPVLRLLDIHSSGIKNLPNSIGKLIHLRYLDLSDNNFQTLPNSVVDLINLRHLCLAECKALNHLPSGMGAIMNLRGLNLANCTTLSYSTSEIGALSALEMLDISQCVKSVEQLMGIENLTNLRILKLRYFRDLTHLHVGMDALTSLERLIISSCAKLEDLSVSISLLTSLKELDISYCTELKELPIRIETLRNLKHLRLEGCWALTYLPTGLSALKSHCTFDKFIVGHPESNHSAQFEELGLLSDSIQGKLEIELPNNMTLRESLDGKLEQLLLHMKRLMGLEIQWKACPKEGETKMGMKIFLEI